MLEASLALLAGLLIGSFLNVCIYRMPRDLSIVSPARSFCPACGETVAWYDNIPVVSYLVLRGRCRHCAKPIPLRYLLVEALTGALFFTFVLALGPTLKALKLCAFVALLMGAMFSDIEERILPDEFTLGGLALGLVFSFVAPFERGFAAFLLAPYLPQRWLSPAEAVLGAALPALSLWGLAELYFRIRHREGLGLGDVKMVAMIGSFLGLEGTVQTVMLGSILGSVIGLIYIYGARKDPSSYELPFGTFLGIGGLAVALLSVW
ncbi:MAG TPA: prepilin peptidase [Bryobacteraceae bacterium]|nr:prepilin peptidase [Bryobacteraceae bacterium]